MKFKNKSVQLVTERGDIRIFIEGSIQEMIDVLYVFKMSVNLLSIIALNRRRFIVFFKSQRVTITN